MARGGHGPAGHHTRGGAWRAVCWALVAGILAPTTATAGAQGATIAEVRVEREGRAIADPAVLALIETAVGEQVSAREVRETIAHLVGLGTFEDVRVEQETLPGGGVRLRYVLVPAHPIDRIEFEGQSGVAESDLRRVVVDQFGVAPRATQAGSAQQALVRALRDRGYPQATAEPRITETHNPDRATLTFAINAGPRAVITDLRLALTDEGPPPALIEQPDVQRGEPYEKAGVDRALQRWADRMRGRGYYEARASHGALFLPEGAVVSIRSAHRCSARSTPAFS